MLEHFSLDMDRFALSSATENSSVTFLGSILPVHRFCDREHGVFVSEEDSSLLLSKSSTGPESKSGVFLKAESTVDVKEIECVHNGECRICQEEENIANLEIPCSCCGSLKYAHRKCIQRWCNEKGDTTCEICHQPYQSGYISAARGGNSESISSELSNEDWGILGVPPIQLRDSRIFAIADAQRHFLETEYDEYASRSTNADVCWRTAALILLAFLLLPHALAMAASVADKEQDPTIFVTLFLLGVMGFLLTCYVMARSVKLLQRRRHQEDGRIATLDVANLLRARHAIGVLFPLASCLSTPEIQ